jgi:hypothetical protein
MHSMEMAIGMKIGFPYYFQLRSIYYFRSKDLENSFQCIGILMIVFMSFRRQIARLYYMADDSVQVLVISLHI